MLMSQSNRPEFLSVDSSLFVVVAGARLFDSLGCLCCFVVLCPSGRLFLFNIAGSSPASSFQRKN
jgi:hypothetical protein